MRLTINQLEKMKQAGKIQGYHLTATKGGRKQLLRRKGKQHYWIEMSLQAFCDEKGLELSREYKFHPSRKWRFDWAIPGLKIAVEFEGIISEKSRHTTIPGYSNDAIKYNEAAMLGWTVLRYTVLNYKNLIVDLKKLVP